MEREYEMEKMKRFAIFEENIADAANEVRGAPPRVAPRGDGPGRPARDGPPHRRHRRLRGGIEGERRREGVAHRGVRARALVMMYAVVVLSLNTHADMVHVTTTKDRVARRPSSGGR